MNSRLTATLVLLLSLCAVQPLLARPVAVILVGLAGDAEVWRQQFQERDAWVQIFEEAGVTDADIHLIESEQVVGSSNDGSSQAKADFDALMAEFAETLTPEDDLIFVLAGQGSTRGDRYNFQVRGPRIKGDQIRSAVESVDVQSAWVFITGPGGKGLADQLALPNVMVYSATAHADEINRTIFGTALTESIKQAPDQSLRDILESTEEKIEEYYEMRSLARLEHATLQVGTASPMEAPFESDVTIIDQWIDATSLGSLLPVPGSPAALAAAEKDAARPIANLSLDELKRLPEEWQVLAGDYEQTPYIKLRDATEEELKLFENLPPPEFYEGHSGVILLREESNLIEAKYASKQTEHYRVLVEDMGIRRLLDRMVPAPGGGYVNLLALKTVHPDGLVLELDIQGWMQLAMGGSSDLIFFPPGVAPGVIVEYAYEINAPPSPILAYCESVEIARSVPTATFRYRLEKPKEQFLAAELETSIPPSQQGESDEAYTQVNHWEWEQVPARVFEPDTPYWENDFDRLFLTSYQNWDEFADWYRSIFRGADVSSEQVVEVANRLTEALEEEDEKIRAAYDYVSKLRYVAIETGVNAWRPRNADTVLNRQFGDCKDKANLLIALLREMDIPANFVLVSRGQPMSTAVPSYHFNHAIAAVPRKDGWLWLDATDESCPYGMMPPGDPHQMGFIFKEDTHEFALIPAYNKDFIRADAVTVEMEHSVSSKPSRLTITPGLVREYYWRSLARGQGPIAVENAIATELEQLWPSAQILDVQLDMPESLSDAPVLKADFVASMPPPLLDFPVPPGARHRNEAWLPYNGYPVRFTQTVTIPLEENEPLQEWKSPEGFSVRDTVSNGILTRTSSLDLSDTAIPAEDLTVFRAAYYEWYRRTTAPTKHYLQ
ncbi:MAG: transglutaminase domain-containing protein [Verrucomicrobiota bacterium]